MKEKRYIVYKHTTPNNKVYIGITCRNAKKLREINLGKHLTEETKEKIRQTKIGKPLSKEAIIKKSKPIICVETNTIYYGMHEAQLQTGINDRNINSCVKGKRKTAGGYHWRYYYESN